ncbi:MAG: universal stress protein [Deltaproteobacteria bacterium]|nr:universal stress protein [Deltaproteobacteria bacterium]
MYNKIVVPLDGSKLAECVLAHVETLAKGCRVKEVSFIRVVEPFTQPGNVEYPIKPEEIARVNESQKAEALAYLKKTTSAAQYAGVKVGQEMIFDSPVADSIIEHCKKNQADLIIIATHGRSGVSRWVYGSVADRLLRAACYPVLMVRAPGCVPGI